MAIPLLSFLDVPHITDDIFDYLSFADLYNSVFVSRSWHSALIPRLWQDIVTFRPIPPLHLHAKTTYIHYFLSPAGRKSLIKHVHHIRALTCRGDALLPVLAKAGMCGLIELNFIIDDQQSSASTATIPRWVQRTAPILDLRTLVQLIAMNPRLHSVSVENIDLDKQMECLALEEFVEAMDPFSSITSNEDWQT
ncbi:hypothetical protein BGZ81_001272 [Podila clonocystis]|nr:hypothetical protein BGZ81_001272 [Podila clonocystis]